MECVCTARSWKIVEEVCAAASNNVGPEKTKKEGRRGGGCR